MSRNRPYTNSLKSDKPKIRERKTVDNRIEACTLRPGDRIKIHPDGVEWVVTENTGDTVYLTGGQRDKEIEGDTKVFPVIQQ